MIAGKRPGLPVVPRSWLGWYDLTARRQDAMVGQLGRFGRMVPPVNQFREVPRLMRPACLDQFRGAPKMISESGRSDRERTTG